MGGSKGGQYTPPAVDNSAAVRAAEEARLAEEKKRKMESAEAERKKNVEASGRKATILAGENGSNPRGLLGN
jgi:hypothetical protein